MGVCYVRKLSQIILIMKYYQLLKTPHVNDCKIKYCYLAMWKEVLSK